MEKKKILQFWQKSLKDNCKPCKNGLIISMPGFTRFEDFYLCVPETGIYFRSANNARYGLFKSLLFVNGAFVGACRMDKRSKIQQLYNTGAIDEAKEYALGYKLWRETILGGRKIVAAKERARISHVLCDISGEKGHELRQIIRKFLKNKKI